MTKPIMVTKMSLTKKSTFYTIRSATSSKLIMLQISFKMHNHYAQNYSSIIPASLTATQPCTDNYIPKCWVHNQNVAKANLQSTI